MRCQRFSPRSVEAFLTWRTDDGVNEGIMPNTPESWTALLSRATSETMFDDYEAHRELFTYFGLVAPHRMSVTMTSFLDRSKRTPE